ncbi:MAG: hypothetical protein MJA83_04180, partial [Gammaproteobacteria bacterium]|nr:hypothetical protein [Gammaproteobacteria bacterium]
TPDDTAGPEDTIVVTLDPAPAITSLSFTGAYPTTFAQLQTELKEDDNFSLVIDTDKPVDQVEIVDFGAGSAAKAATISVGPTVPGVPFNVQITAADRGATVQALPARIRVRDASTGAFSTERDTNFGGGTVDGVDLVNLNTLTSSGTITANLPAGQGAVKLGDALNIDLTASDFSDFLITSPTSDFSFPSPTTFEANKVLTLIFAPATLNESNNNINMRLRRFANGSEVNITELVLVQDAIPNVSALLPGAVPRLISAPAPGQNHVITLSSNQLVSTTITPSMDPAANRGTFTAGFVDTGNGMDFTATLQVPDADNPGDDSSNAWINIQVTNRAGRVATSLVAGATYIVGGLATRDISIPAISATAPLGVTISQYAKVQAGVWEISQVQSVKAAVQGDTAPLTDGFTVDLDDTTLRLLDSSIINGNTGLEVLNDFEETP